ncbi:helix-turn-helix transcriptional regulator [Corynebacterium sp. P6145]|uniref:helix-turn-helix transcriptional regulator n=1 Tax=Corynebacterium antarcticum TaxID=2800405 RepID=UPI0020066D01|nr:helix-turn-helix transcriptional regulator [Corynebacterium antarcticum]MCK7643304.1 helix-turn-helix transcriptional regulator [Corynebacterium antarcticum]MCX7492675.1 helix-turn-helix transcriptional regulator [Corynebacterium antarcticum]
MTVQQRLRGGSVEGSSRCARRALIVWVYAGTAGVDTAVGTTRLSAGQVMLIAAGLRYRIRGGEDAVVIPVELPGELAVAVSIRTAVAALPEQLRLRLLFEFAQNLGYLRPDVERTDFLRCLVAEIIAAQSDAVPVPVAPQPISAEATAVAGTVMADLSVNHSVAQLADIAGVSVRTLQRRFRAETTLSVSRWITRVRLNEAVALIARGRGLQFAAHATGYPGASELIRAYRAETGTTPVAALSGGGRASVGEIRLDDPGVPENETWLNINGGDIVVWLVTGRATVTTDRCTIGIVEGQGVVLPAGVAVHVAMEAGTLLLPLGFRYPDGNGSAGAARVPTVVDFSGFAPVELLRTAVSTYTHITVEGARHDDIFRSVPGVREEPPAGEGDRSGQQVCVRDDGVSRQRHSYVRRMNLARILLAQGRSPTETARTLRYSHAAAFTRAFFAEHGMTPKRYAQLTGARPGPVLADEPVVVPARSGPSVAPRSRGA